MKRLIPLIAAAAIAVAGPANAQAIVHDPTSYASLIRQAQTALDQLNQLKAQVTEAQRLYEGFNAASGVGAFATQLASPQLRSFVPEIDAYLAAARGDLKALGELGRRAEALREQERAFRARSGDAAGAALERQGDRAARDAALGEAAARAGGQRLAGLQELASRIDAAPTARAVMDLQARLAAEQAMIANDQMRLQGLAMAQAAEERLQAQRERERAAAAAQARLELFRRGFN